MRKTIRDLLLLRPRGITYLLRDEFSDARAAGSVNGTPATPGPGTRTVVDTDGDAISIGGGNLDIANPNAGWSDPLFCHGAFTRTTGRVLIQRVDNIDAAKASFIGWARDQVSRPLDGGLNFSFGTLRAYENFGNDVSVGSYTLGPVYTCALVQRSYGTYFFIKGGAFVHWTLLYIWTKGNKTPLYPVFDTFNDAYTAAFARIPDTLWLPQLLAYDSFTRANGALGSTEGAGPDGQHTLARTWTGTTFTVAGNKAINTPTEGAEILTDPGLEVNYTAGLCDSLTKNGVPNVAQSGDVHGGAKAQQFQGVAAANRVQLNVAQTVGTWYQASIWGKRTAGATGDVVSQIWDGAAYNVLGAITGAAYAQLFRIFRSAATGAQPWRAAHTDAGAAWDTVIVDDMSVKALTLSTLFASLESSTADVVAQVELDVVASRTQAGLVLNLDDAAVPANFIIAYHDGTNAVLEKCVAGTYTGVISAVAAYAAGATLVVIKDGTSYSLYYNNVKIGSTSTISDAGIVDNTLHGLFSTYASNQLDNFLVMPRGSNDEYADLDQWSED